MEAPLIKQQKNKQYVFSICMLLATALFMSEPGIGILGFIPEWVAIITGFALMVLGIQVVRQDFGPINSYNILRFSLLLTTVLGILYYLGYY